MIRRATIRIEVHEPDHGPDGTTYTHRRAIPLEWLDDDRYYGYVAFEFQEMFHEMVQARLGER